MSRKSYYNRDHNLDEATSRNIGSFVFPKEKEPIKDKAFNLDPGDLAQSRGLLPSSILTGRSMSQAISYYSSLRDLYGSESAMMIVNILQKISMATEGIRAQQGARILEGSLPKEIEIETTNI